MPRNLTKLKKNLAQLKYLMAHILFRGKLYIVAESEFHDPTWTPTERNKFMMALALQNPSTKSTYEQAIHVGRMWIYKNRGCKYPTEWNSALEFIDAQFV